MEITRLLSLAPVTASTFLFGCRQAGKTWLLRRTVPADIYIDLLRRDELVRYTRDASLLSAELAALGRTDAVVVIDEIQKAPGLLDEVHRAIESPCRPKFVLTGSSARKLKRSHANMLGGRAVTRKLFPLSYMEVRDTFSLPDFLRFGGLPSVFLAATAELKQDLLASYVTTYLKEEVYDEALARDLPAFTKFLDLAGCENGNLINYANLARETGVSAHVIKEYFSILEDTLLGFYLRPFARSQRKRLVGHPKFYLNDPGLVTATRRMLSAELVESGQQFGAAFEHFIILEVMKAVAYRRTETEVSFFRTSDGAEVDLVLEKHGDIVAVEIKSSAAPGSPSGLRSFVGDHHAKSALCVCRTPRAYVKDGIRFVPWQAFVEDLYGGALL